MEFTVTELLREFPRVKRAVLLHGSVILKCREGNFRFSLDTPLANGLVGCLKGLVIRSDNVIDRPAIEPANRESKL